jgi:hypothetical protein
MANLARKFLPGIARMILSQRIQVNSVFLGAPALSKRSTRWTRSNPGAILKLLTLETDLQMERE